MFFCAAPTSGELPTTAKGKLLATGLWAELVKLLANRVWSRAAITSTTRIARTASPTGGRRTVALCARDSIPPRAQPIEVEEDQHGDQEVNGQHHKRSRDVVGGEVDDVQDQLGPVARRERSADRLPIRWHHLYPSAAGDG